MSRYLGIDYGSKRCGIAISDPTKMIASAMNTVPSHELMNFLSGYFKKEAVEKVVIGKPMTLDNQPSQSFVLVERFVAAFKKRFPDIPIVWEDERYTSSMAVEAMIAGGMKKKDRREKGMIDRISAAILLQSYLDRDKTESE
ncbi:Holliday junction resolvase RuvX [Bacteroidota bacterium]